MKAGWHGIDIFVRALNAKLRLEQIKKESLRQKEELKCVNELIGLGVPSDSKISALSWATMVAWHFIARFAPHDPIRKALTQLFTRILELIDGKKTKKQHTDFPLQPTTVPIFRHMVQLLNFCAGRTPSWTTRLGSRVDVVECAPATAHAPAIYASTAWFQRSFESEAVWRLSILNEAGRTEILSKAAENERVLATLRRQDEEEQVKSINEMTSAPNKASSSSPAKQSKSKTASPANEGSKGASSAISPSKAAPSAISPSKAAPSTISPSKAAPSTISPSKTAPSTTLSTPTKGKGTTSKKSAVIGTSSKRSRSGDLPLKPTRKPKTKTGTRKTTSAKVDEDSSMSDEVNPPLIATASILSAFSTLPGPPEPPLPPFPIALIPATALMPVPATALMPVPATQMPLPSLPPAPMPLPLPQSAATALAPAPTPASAPSPHLVPAPAFGSASASISTSAPPAPPRTTPISPPHPQPPPAPVPVPPQSKLNAGRISVWTGPVTSLNCGQYQHGSIVKEIIEARRGEWETLTHVPTTAADITQCIEWHLLGGNPISESIGTDTMRIQPAILQGFCTWTLAYLRQGVIPTRDALLVGPSLRATFGKLFKWFMLQFSHVLSPAIAALGCTLLVHMADSETREDADDYRMITDILTAREHDMIVGEQSPVPILRGSRWFGGCPFARLQPCPTASDSTLDRHGWAATLMLYIINTSRLLETEKEDASTTVSDRYSHEHRVPGTGRYRWYELGVQVAGRIMGMMLLELTDATNLPQSKLLALPMRPDTRARVEAHVESEYAKSGIAIPATRSLANASKSSSKSAQQNTMIFGSLTTEMQEAYATIVRRVLARFIGSAREKDKYQHFFRNIAKRLLMGSAEDVVGPRRVIVAAGAEVKTSNEAWTSPANSAEEERFDSIYWCFSMAEAIKLMTAIDIGPKADRMAWEIVRAQRNYKIYDAGLHHHRKFPCPPNDTDTRMQRLASVVADSAICQHKLERLEAASLALLPDATSSSSSSEEPKPASKVESKGPSKMEEEVEHLELMSDKSNPHDMPTVNITKMSDAGPLPAIPNG